jgi:acetyl-CoA acetyltransferase
MNQAYICDAIRTPIGRYGGALSLLRTDDLGALPIKALMARNPDVDWQAVSDVIYGCANQAGEDNRNVARMSALLAGLPQEVPASTVNRLCGSGMDAVGSAARAIKSGEAQLMIAGGVESMSRAPFVMPKAEGTARIRCRRPRKTSPPIIISSAKRRTAWRCARSKTPQAQSSPASSSRKLPRLEYRNARVIRQLSTSTNTRAQPR